MRAKITQIHDIKKTRGRGISKFAQKFIRVTFKMDDGSWAKTDVCPEYRNYRNWKLPLRSGVGTVIEGLNYRRSGEVNADSPVSISKNQELFKETFKIQAEADKVEDTGQQILFDVKPPPKSNTGDM